MNPNQRGAQGLLIVDDEPDILETLQVVLESYVDGIRVHTAASGAQGLDILARESVDVVISDYKLPGMDGLEFLAQARTIAPTASRIMITAFPDVEIAIQAINDGRISGFLTKPLGHDEIVNAVQSELDEQRAERSQARELASSFDRLRRRAAES